MVILFIFNYLIHNIFVYKDYLNLSEHTQEGLLIPNVLFTLAQLNLLFKDKPSRK